MSKDSTEIASLKSEMDGYEKQKKNAEDAVKLNEDKIERLQTVKTSLQGYKESVDYITIGWNDFLTVLSSDTYWRGNLKMKVEDYVLNAFSVDTKMYFDNIDVVLDAICDEITKLENENAKTKGWIGTLSSWINSIGNEIEKLLN